MRTRPSRELVTDARYRHRPEDAIKTGVERAQQTLRNVKSAWIKEQEVQVGDGGITSYKVNMLISFILE